MIKEWYDYVKLAWAGLMGYLVGTYIHIGNYDAAIWAAFTVVLMLVIFKSEELDREVRHLIEVLLQDLRRINEEK
jgi:hypothetical protein